jgi:hypothetical protein
LVRDLNQNASATTKTIESVDNLNGFWSKSNYHSISAQIEFNDFFNNFIEKRREKTGKQPNFFVHVSASSAADIFPNN